MEAERDPFGELRREGKGEAPALFLRLLHKPDYAYGLAQEFYQGRRKNRSYLTMRAGKLSSLLREMEDTGLLVSVERQRSRKRRVYYKANPSYFTWIAEKGKCLLERQPGYNAERLELEEAAAWIADAIPRMSRPVEETMRRISSLPRGSDIVAGYIRDLVEELRIGLGHHRDVLGAWERLRSCERDKKAWEKDAGERLNVQLREARERIRELEREIAEASKAGENDAKTRTVLRKLDRELEAERKTAEGVEAYMRGSKRADEEALGFISSYYDRQREGLQGLVEDAKERLSKAEERLKGYALECGETGYLDMEKLGDIWPRDDKELAKAISRLAACLNAYVLYYSLVEKGLLPGHLERRLIARHGLD